MPDHNNPFRPDKALADLMNPSNLAELEATYNSAGGILLVAYLKCREESLSQELFSRPTKMLNDEKIEYIAMINTYKEISRLVDIFKTAIKRRQDEREMFNNRAKESGMVGVKDWNG